MQNKAKKRRTIGLGEIKLLIAALSITATLGFWNLFSSQADLAAVAANAASQPVDPLPPQSAPVELPPLPTLIPDVPLDTATNRPSASPIPTPSVAKAPAIPQGKILLGGSAPQARTFAPVTRTRSSK